MQKTYVTDLCTDITNLKTSKSIQSSHYKRNIKVFSKKDTMQVNPSLKKVYMNCTVKEWLLLSKKIEKILLTNDYIIKSAKIISSMIMSFLEPEYEYLMSSYYYVTNMRVPVMKSKYADIHFLSRTMALNGDQDEEHLKQLKKKVNKLGITKFKFVFEKHIQEIDRKNLKKENFTDTIKTILKHYFKKRTHNFKLYKIRKDFIYDSFFLLFLNLDKYQLSRILFYKKNLNFYDHDYEIFVIKDKPSPS